MENYFVSTQSSSVPIIWFYYCKDILTPESWRTKHLSYDACKINIFVKGTFSIFSGKDSYSPKRGDLCVLFPHEIHYGVIDATNEVEYFEFNISPHAFDSIKEGGILLACIMNRETNQSNFCHPQTYLSEKIINACYDILSLLRSNDSARYALAYSDIINLLYDLNTAYKKGAEPVNRNVPDLCSRVMCYINEHYASIPTVKELAKQFMVSPSHLIRKFRATYKCTPYQYLTKKRVSRAVELLASDANVTEVCYKIGFTDCSRFIQVFKLHMGKTPLQFKRDILH